MELSSFHAVGIDHPLLDKCDKMNVQLYRIQFFGRNESYKFSHKIP